MTEMTEAQRLADALTRAIQQADAEDSVIDVARWFVEDSAAELRHLEAVNAQLLEALRDMVNTLTDGPDESDIARVFSVARAAIAAARGQE